LKVNPGLSNVMVGPLFSATVSVKEPDEPGARLKEMLFPPGTEETAMRASDHCPDK